MISGVLPVDEDGDASGVSDVDDDDDDDDGGNCEVLVLLLLLLQKNDRFFFLDCADGRNGVIDCSSGFLIPFISS